MPHFYKAVLNGTMCLLAPRKMPHALHHRVSPATEVLQSAVLYVSDRTEHGMRVLHSSRHIAIRLPKPQSTQGHKLRTISYLENSTAHKIPVTGTIKHKSRRL